MPQRDKVWSIYIAQEGDDDDSPIETLISWTLQNGFETIDNQRAELAAITLSWLFTTSHRLIRDRATKALAALLAQRLMLAARLVRRFQDIDDLYVLDRVMPVRSAYSPVWSLRTPSLTGCATAEAVSPAPHNRSAAMMLRRMKNLLGIVRSLANQTDVEGRTAKEYRDAFLGRFQAVAEAETIALASSAEANLSALVEQSLKAAGPERYQITPGPAVRLNPRQIMAPIFRAGNLYDQRARKRKQMAQRLTDWSRLLSVSPPDTFLRRQTYEPFPNQDTDVSWRGSHEEPAPQSRSAP